VDKGGFILANDVGQNAADVGQLQPQVIIKSRGGPQWLDSSGLIKVEATGHHAASFPGQPALGRFQYAS